MSKTDIEEVKNMGNSRLLKEIDKSRLEKQNDIERLEYEKKNFAEDLKKRLGAEIKEVLSQVPEQKIEKPKKANKLKKFFERLINICQ